MGKNIFLLDNFDSFTYNLVDEFRSAGHDVRVYRNSIAAEKIFEKMKEAKDPILVISPGPGTPDEAGCLLRLIALCHRKFPIVGICLGHQAICRFYGGVVGPAPEIMHGKSSLISHTGTGPFEGMPSPLPFARYHSLAATVVPATLEVIAQCDGTAMAVMNRADRVVGFQFHPESIMSPNGSELLRRTLDLVSGESRRADVQALLNLLYAGKNLSAEQTRELFSEIIRGNVEPATLAAILTSLKLKGETPEEISGAAAALSENARPFPRPDYDFCDIVGTGGDGVGTINISTTSAIVAATCGVKVAKHGNRSVSSKSGSSDLLNALGMKTTIPPAAARECLDRFGFCFLFAAYYHGGMRYAAPVRQAMKTRTIFNVLGPLINPANPTFILLGVYSPALVRPIAEALRRRGFRRAMVVHGNGLDEVSVSGKTQCAELLPDGEIREYELAPSDFGLPAFPPESVLGGNPEENRKITEAILRGNGTDAHNATIAANVAPLLYMNGNVATLAEGAKLALETLASGKAWERAREITEFTQGK